MGFILKTTAAFLLVPFVLVSVGCQSDSKPAATPAALSALPPDKTQQFEDKTAGIRFKYPSDWKPRKNGDSLFSASAPKGSAKITLDVPRLPWHPPGMIPIGSVAGGYIDDVKKNRIHDAKTEENADLKIPDAQAKRVKLSGHENGRPSIDVAVTIVHSDKVFIISCDSDDAGYNVARQALDTAVGSIEWLK